MRRFGEAHNDKVSEWLREGSLRTTPVCLPLVANHLYGPSYLSLDYALALHSMIPKGWPRSPR